MKMLSNILGQDVEGDIAVSGVTSDSRAVRRGFVFAALSGDKVDGADYVRDAIHNGAVCVLAQTDVVLPKDISILVVRDENPRQKLAKMAARFYDAQPGTVVAVTGTNGKTSVVNFVQQLWALSGIEKGVSFGTLGLRGDVVRSGSMTTPDPVSLQAEAADLASAGVTHLALEASSHGIHQYRLDGLRMNAAAFTNLTQDHLDYHGDMDSYFESKARLFSQILPRGSRAILNADDDRYVALRDICDAAGHEVVSYGEAGKNICLKSYKPKSDGQEIGITVDGVAYNLTIPLVGHFQVMNALCALALSGAAPKALEQLSGVAGRLQLVPDAKNRAVYVDYAHTPDAIVHVLKALRPHTNGRLICIAGCGGDRDARKRPLMGQMAARYADVVIATDDNPRSEDPASIRKQFIQGAPNAIDIGDRTNAIREGIAMLGEGDVLVIAGKGHESGQDINGTIHPFNDFDITTSLLKEGR